MLDIKCMFTHSPPHLFAGVDLFAFGASAQYMDLASLAAIPRYTCGEVRAVHIVLGGIAVRVLSGDCAVRVDRWGRYTTGNSAGHPPLTLPTFLQVYHYPGFMAARDEVKLLHEVGAGGTEREGRGKSGVMAQAEPTLHPAHLPPPPPPPCRCVTT